MDRLEATRKDAFSTVALPPETGKGMTIKVAEQTNDRTFEPGDLAFGAVLEPGVWPTIMRKLYPCLCVAFKIR